MIFCDRLVRIFSVAGIEVQALQGLDLMIAPGELTALVGASGSGKSTLLGILAGLDVPDRRPGGGGRAGPGRADRRAAAGLPAVDGRVLVAADVPQPVHAPDRRAERGPADGAGRVAPGRAAPRAAALLELLGVADCRDQLVPEMSGGQQQRVAVAVALANSPRVLLADEPTGELDTETAAQVFGALRTANAELGVTVLIVTHDAGGVRARAADDRDPGRPDQHRGAAPGRDRTPTGREELVAQEYSVLDRAGRLQLPGEYVAALGMRDRVRLALEPDHIGVWPDQPAAAERPASRRRRPAAGGGDGA